MKIKKLYVISFIAASLTFFTSCNVNNEPMVSSVDTTGANKQTENIVTNTDDKDVTAKSTGISVSESTEMQSTNVSAAIEEKPLFSIDLDYDGITEDFFAENSVLYDGYRIVMYSDNEKTQIAAETNIDRTDKIEIYTGIENKNERCFVNPESGYKTIILRFTYVASKDRFEIQWYIEEIYRAIYCYANRSSCPKEEFDNAMSNTKKFLKESQDLEYVETINLSQLMNISQTLIKDINICNDMKSISVYSLQDDPFGRKLKFDNGLYSYYANDSDKIEIYKRKRHVYHGSKYESPDNHIEETDEDEYLFCLKSPENYTVELVYMGIPSENYLFSYDCYSGLSDNEHHIKEYNEILNDTQTFLSKDEWEYDKTIEL